MVTIKSLKEKWEFTGLNVVDLINEIVELLHHYHHSYVTSYGVACMLDTYIDSKKELIEILMKLPTYNGNLQAVSMIPMERKIDKEEIRSLLDDYMRQCATASKLIKRTNDNGKTVEQIILEGISDMPTVIGLDGLKDLERNNTIDISSFNRSGENIKSRERYNAYRNLILYDDMFRNATPMLDKEDIDALKNVFGEEFKMSSSQQKSSRVFNKLAEFMGIDTQKDKTYTKRFAQYADMINPKTNEMIYVISLHPIDYLKMSIGNTWASCHTIDFDNINQIRCINGTNHYSGAYRGGTLSYMLDGVSMVTYLLKPNDSKEHPEREFKIFRNMMHYKNGLLVQGRVYPQENDGATNLYDVLRKYFEEMFTPGIGNGTHINMWTKPNNRVSSVVESTGQHYRDYTCFSSCSFVKLKDYEEKTGLYICSDMLIGHSGIDLRTGEEYSNTGKLSRDYHSEYDELKEE